MPGRRTVFVTHATCVTAAQARNVMSVYRSVERVPVGAGADTGLVEAARARISGVIGVVARGEERAVSAVLRDSVGCEVVRTQ